MANTRRKKSQPAPAPSGDGSKSTPRATNLGRNGDALIQNDIVYGHPDRDIVFGNRSGEKIKPPEPIDDDIESPESNSRRR